MSPAPFKAPENYWYAILDAHAIPKTGKFTCLKRFSKNLILWLDAERGLICMEDRCAHKGAPLSKGKLVEGCIRCPYHGLKYDTTGKCVEAPALGPNRPIPEYLRTTVFTVRSQYGFVWMWWGTDAPTEEIPYYPELMEEPTHQEADCFHYPVSFFRVMESNFDAYHIDHLHGGFFPKLGSIVHSVKCEVKGKRITAITEFRHTSEGDSLFNTNAILYPGLAMGLCEQRKLKNIITCAPIDENTTYFMVRFYMKAFAIPVLGGLYFKLMGLLARHILAPQDFAVQSLQTPKETGMGTDRLLLPADRAIVEYWKMMRQDQFFQEKETLSPQEEHTDVSGNIQPVL